MNYKIALLTLLTAILIGCGHKHRHKHVTINQGPNQAIVGEDIIGRIDSSDDVDWYVITLESHKSYRFCGSDNVVIRLVDADGVSVLGEGNGCLEFCTASAGRYYLVVALADEQARWGNYELSATLLGDCAGPSEPPADDTCGDHHCHGPHCHRHTSCHD